MFKKLQIKEGRDNVVLLSCGAFSPPTIMHTRIMEMAKEYLEARCEVNVALGVLSPVHDDYRKPDLTSGQHRIRMLQLACEKSTWIEPWEWECQQATWTRTRFVVEKLEALTRCRVMLCVGDDFLGSLATPSLWADEDIDSLCGRGILVIQRLGIDINKIIYSHNLLFHHRWKIHLVPQIVSNDISSTNIRLLVARKLSIKYLVDDTVGEYIESHHLFK